MYIIISPQSHPTAVAPSSMRCWTIQYNSMLASKIHYLLSKIVQV